MTAVYKRNPQVEEAPLGGDLMLFDPVKSQFFVLNSTMDGPFELRVDHKIVSYPDRYSDPRGIEIWNWVLARLAEQPVHAGQKETA